MTNRKRQAGVTVGLHPYKRSFDCRYYGNDWRRPPMKKLDQTRTWVLVFSGDAETESAAFANGAPGWWLMENVPNNWCFKGVRFFVACA